MKNVKKILMILGSLIILGQISFSEVNLKDPNIQRLIKIAKEKEATEKRAEQESKKAAELASKQEKLAKEKEEREKKVGQEAQNKKIIQEKEAENKKVMEEKAKKLAEEKEEKAKKLAAEKEEKAKKLAEEKAKKLAYKNMTESERMDVEIQRIKGEIEAITHNIDKYKKNTEFLNQMEQRFELLENKMKK